MKEARFLFWAIIWVAVVFLGHAFATVVGDAYLGHVTHVTSVRSTEATQRRIIRVYGAKIRALEEACGTQTDRGEG